MGNSFTAGVQHIGMPTNDMNVTIDFYKRLGFDIAYETIVKEDNCRVCFFKLDTLCIEVYENHQAPMQSGAVDHIAIDVTDIDAAWDFAAKGGFKMLDTGINALPFWKNGIKFFKIEGPNREIIEFCQIL